MSESDFLIYIADWSKDKDALSAIRKRVFIEEQGVPQDMEWDEFDTSATHFLASLNGKNIATARLILDAGADGRIGRMAVLPEYRNQGYGSKLLDFILSHATKQAFSRLHLHAQTDAIPFYETQGFTACGDIFYEANIPHREMFKNIC